ncbi:leukotriene B4 receptor 1-like [Chanos chanos]|uniref:Leukotriene B4 receptor 1-like n=1 Tax=Chanos chanos TaxID=29144 RepID=A0A6J2UPR5_CHACN|nr:leukotriene B4 receptor 1-like [Chanos chanos]
MQQYNSSALANGTYGPDLSAGVLVPSMILGLCFVLGVPGNVTVLAVLIQRLKGDNFTFRLMLSLAVSDLLTLLTLPVWICALLWGWIFGLGLCKFLSYLIYWSLYSSVMNVTLLSAQRYVQVLYPNRWSKLGNPVRLALLLSTWVVGGVLAAPALVHRQVRRYDGEPKLYCHALYASREEQAATLLLETLLGFVIPFSVLVSFYFSLHKRVNQTPLFSSRRMTRLVSSIVVCFFIFWVPIHIINILTISAIWSESDKLMDLSDFVAGITGALTFINSCVDPFLYAFSSKALRRSATKCLPESKLETGSIEGGTTVMSTHLN